MGIHDASDTNPRINFLKNREVFDFANGFVQIPNGPGLGVEVDEERVVEQNKNPHNWKNPLWRTYDGTPIEW